MKTLLHSTLLLSCLFGSLHAMDEAATKQTQSVKDLLIACGAETRKILDETIKVCAAGTKTGGKYIKSPIRAKENPDYSLYDVDNRKRELSFSGPIFQRLNDIHWSLQHNGHGNWGDDHQLGCREGIAEHCWKYAQALQVGHEKRCATMLAALKHQ